MHVAIGYNWFATAAGYHIERAFAALGHAVTYVGLGTAGRPGYAEGAPLNAILALAPQMPDFYLWIDPAGRYFPPGIEELPIPTACYLIDVHLGTWREQVAKFFDVVFVAQQDYIPRLRAVVGHDQVYWLPLAAASDMHYDHKVDRTYDVGFVGNLARAHQQTARARRLQLLAEQFQTNDFHRQYTPAEVGEVYSRAKIVFNTSIAGDVTMRIFEGTACGALVLTDAIQNGLDEQYRVGEEIVVFDQDADLVEKVRYYLEHPEEREAIARAGQARALAHHTYEHRAAQIVDTLSAPTLQRAASMRTASVHARNAARRDIYTHLHMLDALLDMERAAGTNPIVRAWRALPCLARRVLL